MVVHQQSAGMASTREPDTIAPYGSSLFCYFSEEMEQATEFWASSLAAAKAAACG